MRAILSQPKQLAEALAFVTKAAPRRTPILILDHVRVEVADNMLLLEATDLDIVHSAQVEIADGEPGICTVPAARLARLVAELPGDARVALKLASDGRLLITCGRGHWRLPTLAGEDFPQLARPENDAARFVLSANTAQVLVQRTEYAISAEETRFYLNGVNLRRHGEKLVGASTNGHMLSELTLAIDPGRDLDVIVPMRMVAALKAIARCGDIDVTVDSQKILLTQGSWLALGKLIDATFPDYQRILPKISANRAEVGAGDLLAAIARLRAVADADSVVGLRWGDNAPLLQACLARAEENIEDVDATVFGAGRVAANPDYLTRTIEALGAKCISIDHDGDSNPIRITAASDDAGPASSLAVVMPMTWLRPSADPQPIRTTRGK